MAILEVTHPLARHLSEIISSCKLECTPTFSFARLQSLVYSPGLPGSQSKLCRKKAFPIRL